MVVVHIHALHNIVLNGMEGLDDVYLYVSFSVASIKKVTSKKLYNPKNDSIVVFNEVKYIPLIVSELMFIASIAFPQLQYDGSIQDYDIC